MSVVISRVEARDEMLVIIGDANRHLGKAVPGNDDKVSYGGKLIVELLETNRYVLLNSTPKAKNGPLTREDPSDSEIKSVLDLVIVSSSLEKYVEEMIIDKKREFTPFKQNKGKTIAFPDHYAISITFKGLPLRNDSVSLGKKYTQWNTNKKGGWNRYKILTNSNKKLDEIAASESEDPDVLMKGIEKEMNNIKYKAFGKVKIKKRKEKDGKLEMLLVKKEKVLTGKASDSIRAEVEEIDEEIAHELKIRQRSEIEKELAELKRLKETKGSAAAIFSLKGKIVGKKKESDEPSAVINPKTGKLTFNPSEIVKISADYCKESLTNREPREGYEQDMEWKRMVHEARMKETNPNDAELSLEMFQKTKEALQKKDS